MKKIKYFQLFILLFVLIQTKAQPILLRGDVSGYMAHAFVKDKIYLSFRDSLFQYNDVSNQKIFIKNIGETIFAIHSFNIGNTFFFITQNNTNTNSLWKSDGTAPNTVKVGSYNSIEFFGGNDSKLYLLIDDGIHGKELWKVNSSLTGLTLIKDIAPGPVSSGIIKNTDVPVHLGNNIYFYANAGDGYKIWRSNGTEAGTEAFFINNTNLCNVDNKLFFTKYTYDSSASKFKPELWKTNGNPQGTSLVRALDIPGATTSINSLTSFKNELYFIVQAATEDTILSYLYKSDGTYHGTKKVKQITGIVEVVSLMVAGDNLAFVSTIFTKNRQDYIKEVFYKSDGTANGTKAFFEALEIDEENAIGNLVLFSGGFDFETNKQLYQSDLTTENTRVVKDIFGGDFPNPSSFRIGKDKALFFTEDYFLPSEVQNYWFYNPAVPSSTLPYFTLVDADTDKDIQWLKEGDVILKSWNDQFNIRYNTQENTGSVVFKLNDIYKRTDNDAPFALAYETNGNYAPWSPTYPGSYKLTAIPFPLSNGNGSAGTPLTINFSIKNKNSWNNDYSRTSENLNSGIESLISTFPNPSADLFNFTITPQSSGKASVEIYQMDGTFIKTVFDGDVTEGNSFNITWNPSDHKEGVYLCKYKSEHETSTEKIILTR